MTGAAVVVTYQFAIGSLLGVHPVHMLVVTEMLCHLESGLARRLMAAVSRRRTPDELKRHQQDEQQGDEAEHRCEL